MHHSWRHPNVMYSVMKSWQKISPMYIHRTERIFFLWNDRGSTMMVCVSAVVTLSIFIINGGKIRNENLFPIAFPSISKMRYDCSTTILNVPHGRKVDSSLERKQKQQQQKCLKTVKCYFYCTKLRKDIVWTKIKECSQNFYYCNWL